MDSASWRRGADDEAAVIALFADRSRASVDVGAHAGAVSFLLSRVSTHCYAMEPNPAFGYLRSSLPTNCTFIACGVGAEPGNATLRVPVSPRGELAQMATIAAANELLGLPVREVEVPIVRVDDVVPVDDIGFMKIDVEGGELQVLDGASETLERSRPGLLIECEERHRHGGVAALLRRMHDLRYQGYFLLDGQCVPVARFRLAEHQDARNVGEAGKTGPYVNSFLFLPA